MITILNSINILQAEVLSAKSIF